MVNAKKKKKPEDLHPGTSKKAPLPVQTTNRYAVLPVNSSEDEDDEQTPMDQTTNQPSNNKTRRSPIVINSEAINAKDKNSIIKMIREDFKGATIKYSMKTITTISATREDFARLKNTLIQEEIKFHTYLSQNEKERKYVLKGLPLLELQDIKDDLISQGLDPQKIVPMKTKNETTEYPMYFVALKPNENMKCIKKIKYICSVKVGWERYKNKRRVTAASSTDMRRNTVSTTQGASNTVVHTLLQNALRRKKNHQNAQIAREPIQQTRSSAKLMKLNSKKIERNQRKRPTQQQRTTQQPERISEQAFPTLRKRTSSQNLTEEKTSRPEKGARDKEEHKTRHYAAAVKQNTQLGKTEQNASQDFSTPLGIVNEIKILHAQCDLKKCLKC